MTEPHTPAFREMLSDAIRYWEPRRLLFNAALALVVAWRFAAAWPASKQVLHAEPLLALFILAVIANVLYCAAYVPDLALQASSFRATWRRARWVLLLLGTAFAAALAYFFTTGLVGDAPAASNGSLTL